MQKLISNGNNVWFSSDIHFGHANIIKFCNRPFSTVEEMDEAIIADHNRVVKENDIVFHLGDFTFRKIDNAVSYLKRLNGYHHLIRGNHDKWLSDENAAKVVQRDMIRQGDNPKRVVWVKDYYQFSWYDEYHNDTFFYSLMHYPLLTWHHAYKPNSFNIFGHVHGTINDKLKGRQLDAGIDNLVKMTGSYRPISITEVNDLMLNTPVDCPEMENINKTPWPK